MAEQLEVLKVALQADVGDFDRNMSKGDKAIERQAKALDEHAKALDQQVKELKKAEQPNLALARAFQTQAKEARAASAALIGQISTVKQSEAASKAHYASLVNVETGMKGATLATKGFQVAVGTLTRTFAPLIALFGAAAITKAADDFKSFSGQVANATRETKDAAGVQRELLNISKQTGAELNTTVDVFRRIQLGAKDLGKSNKDVLQVVETVQKLGIVGRASTEAMNAGLLQFGQAMSTGRVYAEEFNSVVENLPIVAEAIADSMGMTVGQLKLAVKDGKVSSADFFNAIQKNYAKVKDLFEDTPVTLAQGYGIFKIQLAEAAAEMDKTIGVTDTLGKGFQLLGEFLHGVTVFFREARGPLVGYIEVLKQFYTAIFEAGKVVLEFINTINGMAGVADLTKSAFSSMTGDATSFAQVMAKVSIQVLRSIREIRKALAEASAKVNGFRNAGSKETMTAVQQGARKGGIKGGFDALAKTFSAQDDIDRINSDFETARSRINAALKVSADGGVNGTPGKKTNTAASDSKKKKGKSQSNVDQDAVRQRMDSVRDSIRDLQLAAREALADLGPFADETEKLALKQQFASKEVALYNAGLDSLRKLTVKTTEGQMAKREAIEDTTRALKENGIEIKQTANEQVKLSDDLARATQSYERLRREIQANQTAQSVKNRLSYELDALNEAFAAEQVTAQQYYDERLALIDRNANIEKTVILTRIDLAEQEMAQLRDTNLDLEKRRQLEVEILRLRGDLVSVDQTRGLQREDLNRDQRQKERDAGQRLKQSAQSALSDAISSVLTGDKTTNAIKKFASAMKNSLIQAFSDALSQRIVRAFDGLFQSLGQQVNKLSGQTVSLQPSGVPNGQLSNLSSVFGSGQQGSAGGFFSKLFGGGGSNSSAIAGGGAIRGLNGQYVGGAAGGLSLITGLQTAGGLALVKGGQALAGGGGAGRALGGVGLGAAGGALAGAAIGSIIPGIGTAIGAGVGALLGGTSAAVSNANKGGFFSTGAGVATAFALGGPLGFLALGAMKKRKAAEKEAKFAAFNSRIDSILGSTDTNNLESLRQASFSIQAAFRKSGGETNKESAKRALAQINQARVEREKAIKEFIKDIKVQNEDVQTEIDKIGKNEVQQYFLDQQQELRQITRERQEALEKFKDSEEAKTEILKNEALKRELVTKQEQQAYKDSVENARDLLEKRDEVLKSNFFRRAKTAEQTKAQQLSEIDSQLAATLQGIQEFQKRGSTLPEGLQGLDFILRGASGITTQNIDLQLVINEAENVAATQKIVENALDDFLRKIGATAA